MPRAPVYFIAHGGPPTMYDHASGAYRGWACLGERIRGEVKDGRIKGLVCVSAHWEGEEGGEVKVNHDTSNPLIYDFYNFPRHYYLETFRSAFPATLPSRIVEVLKGASPRIAAQTTARGLDHGLWVPFKVMFGQEPAANKTAGDGPVSAAWTPEEMPPIIQLSMDPTGTVEGNAELGRALGALRDEGYAIVATGQPVHNLRAFMTRCSDARHARGFEDFFRALVDAATGRGPVAASSTSPSRADALADVAALPRHPAYKLAHPTDEHFIPLVIAAAAAAADDSATETAAAPPAEVVYEESSGPLGWAFLRWD